MIAGKAPRSQRLEGLRDSVTTTDLRDALIQLETAMGIGRPIGAAELPDEIRFFRVLTALRDILCPRVSQLVLAADTTTGDLATIVADVIVMAVGRVPVPATTIAKHIAEIGVERFCKTPAALLDGSDKLPEQKPVTADGGTSAGSYSSPG
jgi:hypothetical protein